jgi:cell division protein FtsB
VSTNSYRVYRVRPRGGSRSRIDWDRIGRIVLVLILFAVLLSYLNPLINLADAWRDSHSERARFDQLTRENAELQRREQALTDPEALEREARDLGMVAPGERPYVIRGLRD